MHRSLSKLGILVALLGVAGALMLGAGQDSQPVAPQEAQPQPEPQPEPKTSTMLATYDPQAIFAQSERSTRLTEKLAEIQAQMQTAQQAGDQARMFQLQQQGQILQNTEIEAFLAALDEALPGVAKEAGVQIVAIDFAYLDESLGTPTDLTQALSEKID